jgi:N-acetylmuramoyl-L-alanine amidase
VTPRRITVHCTATKNGVAVPAAEIDRWHKAKGWTKIGYHLVIQPDGEAEAGRGLNEQGAHVEGANKDNVGIVMAGTDKFTRRQFDVLRYQIDGITQLYSIPTWEIYCHNQFTSAQKQGKICPGFSANVLLAWYIGHYEKALAPYLLTGA